MEPLLTLTTEPGTPLKAGSAKEVPMRESARPTEPGTPPPLVAAKALTVAEVVSRIRTLIERQFPSPLWVEGELSNCSYPASGHIYFSLVDEQATDRFGQRLVLPCAFYRSANQGLKVTLEDGMKVLCFGQVTTYERQGQYQLRVLRVQLKGIGELQKAYEQLKKRLAAEGLFDETRKRPIPSCPRHVGIITSRSGSAIHDMVSKLRGYFHVIVLPVKVQGDGAAQEIVEAIETANARRLADVLIVGRGGGSVEDLWAFNEEPVARAIARSRIPVISAVGHEDDWTIADYVADLRASTPTDAAKRLVQERQTLDDQTRELVQRLIDTMQLFLEDQSVDVARFHERLRLLHPRHQLTECTQRGLQAQVRLIQTMAHALDREERQLQALAGRLQALSPLAVLGRGYSITFKLPGRSVMTDAASLRIGDSLETLFARGTVVSSVDEVLGDAGASHGAD